MLGTNRQGATDTWITDRLVAWGNTAVRLGAVVDKEFGSILTSGPTLGAALGTLLLLAEELG
jgi:hypothetical protein